MSRPAAGIEQALYSDGCPSGSAGVAFSDGGLSPVGANVFWPGELEPHRCNAPRVSSPVSVWSACAFPSLVFFASSSAAVDSSTSSGIAASSPLPLSIRNRRAALPIVSRSATVIQSDFDLPGLTTVPTMRCRPLHVGHGELRGSKPAAHLLDFETKSGIPKVAHADGRNALATSM
jgi:hypothetical protein